MNKKISIVLASISFLILSGCQEERLTIETESTIPVRVLDLEPKSIKEFATATGTVYAVQDIELMTEAAGRYRLKANPRTGLPFRMGDRVNEGEVLVALENPEYINQVAFDSKKLNYESSEREYTKQQSIYEKGGITLKEVADAERAFVDAKYSMENATLSLAKLEVKAPFTGVIVDLPHFTDGEWIASGILVARVMDYSRLYAELTFPGKDMGRVARGQKVEVSDYSQVQSSVTGEVTQISPALDPESRMFKLKILVPNPNLEIRPGTFVRADIVVQERDSVIVIPKDIIIERRGSKNVFIVERGMAVQRRIQTGIESSDEVEVVEGLNPEDRLIVEGFETLRSRSQVRVIQ